MASFRTPISRQFARRAGYRHRHAGLEPAWLMVSIGARPLSVARTQTASTPRDYVGGCLPTLVLLLGVSLGRRQVLAQFLCRATWTIARRIALNAPSFLQRPGVDRVEPLLVELVGHFGVGARVVAGDDQRPAVW